MASTINVGQTLPLSIAYLDQNGQPMATTPTPDATPAWANSNPAAGTLTAAADGLSATELGVAAGLDTVQLTVTVGGKLFTATLDVTVDAVAASQTLTTINIVPGTPTP